MALKHVVIGGGTGFIGTQIINSLSHNGFSYTCISRRPGRNRMTWNDLDSYGLPDDTTAVINVAGRNILDPSLWTEEFKRNIINSRVQTTKSLNKAIVNTKAEAFVTISGVAYYKPNAIEYTEESQCEKYDFFSELCHDWEAAAKLPKTCPIRQTTIRSGVVLGKGGGMIKSMYLPFFCGCGGIIGDGKQYMPWIHISDLVQLFMFSVKNNNVQGILNGVAPQTVTNEQFTKQFASKMHRPAFMCIPKIVLDTVLNEERAKILVEGQKVVPKRAGALGFQYQYPDINSALTEIFSKDTTQSK